MNFIQTIKDVLTTPTTFFSSLAKSDNLSQAFIYLLVLGIFSIIMSFIVDAIFRSFFLAMNVGAAPREALFLLLIGLPVSFVVLIVGSFIGAGIAHLWFMLFGARVSYIQTYQLITYASTPTMLLSWIPFIGGLAGIWQAVLIIIGLQKTHKFSQGRAIAAVLIPIGIAILLAIAIIIITIVLFAGVASIGMASIFSQL